MCIFGIVLFWVSFAPVVRLTVNLITPRRPPVHEFRWNYGQKGKLGDFAHRI